MDLGQARRLLSEIPGDARVLDVGGGAAPFPRADHVIDALPFEKSGAGSDGSAHRALGIPARFTSDNWTRIDMCARRPWPFPDKAFDLVVCAHVLEDLRDPVWVCSEMSRVGRAGYIEAPSRVEEQSRGVENPRYAGYSHHRWLIEERGGSLEFRHKPHALHAIDDAIVVDLPAGTRINPRHAIVVHRWKDRVEAREVLEFNEAAVIDELCGFARETRRLPDLTMGVPMPLARRIKRHLFFRRLARGGR
jgi:hypothetical protein